MPSRARKGGLLLQIVQNLPQQGSPAKARGKTRGGGSRRDDGGKAARIHPRRARRLPDIGHRPVDATGRGMRVIRLILPYPVSANRYWRIWRNRAVRSAEAAAYKSVVRRIAQEAGAMPSEGAVAVYVRLIPKANKDGGANKTVIDLDNALKVALDALQGVAYHNDRQVRRIAADYADEPVTGGGLAVEVGNWMKSKTEAEKSHLQKWRI
ncbi:phage associated protein [Neisseria gonorrhoeae]|uniref:Phage associated protein n=2 Tax=Neisseria gonorrhoeae TaxID=485 RepID=A0A378VY37_NEIGO|nr:phage associated protein [Neisseria gonorrhoeae]